MSLRFPLMRHLSLSQPDLLLQILLPTIAPPSNPAAHTPPQKFHTVCLFNFKLSDITIRYLSHSPQPFQALRDSLRHWKGMSHQVGTSGARQAKYLLFSRKSPIVGHGVISHTSVCILCTVPSDIVSTKSKPLPLIFWSVSNVVWQIPIVIGGEGDCSGI